MKEKMLGYKIFKTILSPIYKLWYHPTIIGKENIPKEGPILLVGNHVHLMDQCNIVLATKRCIYYMAKKEYFDDKKVAWFFKAAKCIPVDRSRKDPEATATAIEMLNKGQAIGIFPEGTRNALKEARIKEIYDKYFKEERDFENLTKVIKKNKASFVNYLDELVDQKIIKKEEFKEHIEDVDSFLKEMIKDKRITEKDYYNHILLPLKFGSVSMAHKTNALLVPYAITGEYKFRSKNLVIRIGKPFSPSDDLEKANQKLAEEIIKLIKENEKNSGK